MFILRDLLTPLQQQFSTTAQGQRRSVWFVYTLLAVVVPFTSSMVHQPKYMMRISLQLHKLDTSQWGQVPL